ncbi:MAG: hypothetical protein HYZ28_10090 [Myxococcales bacterium]|nr:hypothetical protein [Myxococcales bacterium]
MAETLDPRFTDKRTCERYIRSGQLDEKAFERHLKSLPDVAEKSAPVETTIEAEGEEDGGEPAGG